MRDTGLSWFGIVRLGFVQAALGAIVVLTTSTLNRVMVVELAMAAAVPGALVTLHHAMQLLRPRMGYGSDRGQRRTPWIVGGMIVLAIGGVGAAASTALMASRPMVGLAAAVLSFAMIGGGVSAAGTSLLVLMAKQVAKTRRAAAATIVWMMMIAGFAITATVAGKLLDPFSGARLVEVAAGISVLALAITAMAMWRLEGQPATSSNEGEGSSPRGLPAFRRALREVWQEPKARRFTAFVFVSMLSYSAQDLILEPFAGAAFGMSPGESTQLAGAHHGGIFVGMLLVAVMASTFKNTVLGSPKWWVVGGCLASAAAMVGLVAAGLGGGAWPLRENVFALGLANGVFSIAAITAMMTLASEDGQARSGLRMGLWGAAQAIAFGAGGFVGAVLADGAGMFLDAPGAAYAFVFALEAAGFVVAHRLALGGTMDISTVVESQHADDTLTILPGHEAAE